MKYGFVIDNRKCIGCHACTVACKSEHDVSIGVNRTWVKQTEKGEFPNTRRVFSVLRCNHCTDAPCVEICPVEALYVRDDGIVDFNNDRCIGCKSCMQACPYDALYIDPETNTAAKCNYCAHRVDVGLEPACVNICPEHAIISGDMDDPESEISQLLSREQVTVRKPEKYTGPNVFYIDGDRVSLDPSVTERSGEYMWNTQTSGVGHYAKYAESKASGTDPQKMLEDLAYASPASKQATFGGNGTMAKKSVEVLMENARRVYDTPDKGVLWGWEVSAYVLTKAVAAGLMLVLFLSTITGVNVDKTSSDPFNWFVGLGSLVFLGLTGALLVKDLDRPDRFVYVLLRPQWRSWLVRGGYSITFFGGFVTLWLVSIYFGWGPVAVISWWASQVFALLVAVYTAFLFAQAKGRDFWQSPTLAIHMVIHSIMAGAAVIIAAVNLTNSSDIWEQIGLNFISYFIGYGLVIAIGVNLTVIAIEMMTTHPTKDSKIVAKEILSGRYALKFWLGCVLAGNVIPVVLILVFPGSGALIAAILVLAGIYITEHIWVEAPQRVPLT